uniref:Uncharacterized protein LOC8269545 n=2 Tax=Rhizophora mucronata TaxID=61149 RepID=A0A2P2MF90_RHIMU
MVRNTDAEQLDPMYERRVLKAAVQFFWIGGQLNLLPDNSLDVSKDAFLGFPANELVHWKSSILWSLKKFENPEKPLVTWDIIAALLAFKQSIPNFVDEILFKWLSVTYLDSSVSHSLDDVLIRIPQTLLTATSRQLHLLNVICRHVILSQLMADEINSKANIGPTVADMEHSPLWLELLFISERELRERLVGLSFSAFLTHMSHSAKSSIESGNWSPVGVAQMELWITRNHDHIRVQLKELASEVVKAERRFEPMESGDEEQCIHCSALVPFDSPDVAFCCGTETVNGVLEKHKLARCSTSMQMSGLQQNLPLQEYSQRLYVPFAGYYFRDYCQIFCPQHLQCNAMCFLCTLSIKTLGTSNTHPTPPGRLPTPSPVPHAGRRMGMERIGLCCKLGPVICSLLPRIAAA